MEVLRSCATAAAEGGKAGKGGKAGDLGPSVVRRARVTVDAFATLSEVVGGGRGRPSIGVLLVGLQVLSVGRANFSV